MRSASLALALGLAACGQPTAPETAKAPEAAPLVAKADMSIRGIADSPEYLVIDIKPGEGFSEADYLFGAGRAIQGVGRALQAGAADAGEGPTILITVSADTIDRLGKEGEVILASIYVPRADLMAANFDNLSVGRSLNLATDVDFSPAGARAIAAYCVTERGQGQSQPFCTLALSKAR